MEVQKFSLLDKNSAELIKLILFQNSQNAALNEMRKGYERACMQREDYFQGNGVCDTTGLTWRQTSTLEQRCVIQ